MPASYTTFPPGFPTIDNVGVLTISRWLNTPTMVDRALRSIVLNRFIADVLLTGRVTPEGGAISYETGESIYADRSTLEAIMPGAEYPISTVGQGAASVATVKKWGLDAKVVLEAVRRERMSPVNRALIKLGNSIVRQVDSVGLAAIVAAVTTTQAATATWGTSSAKVVLDLMLARATIVGQNQGYEADTLVLSDTKFAAMANDEKVLAAMRREDPGNVVYTGKQGRIAGLDILLTSNSPFPTESLVCDRRVLGGLADEEPFSSNTWWVQDTEEWRLRAKRVTVPWVSEPAAAVRITGI
jgi:hypothetical protein